MKYFKVAALALALATALSAAGCGQKEADNTAQTAAAETKADVKEEPKKAAQPSELVCYEEFPMVPDFGAMFGRERLSEQGSDILMQYFYKDYEGREDDESAYIALLEKMEYSVDADLMYEYMTALENSGAENVTPPILYSNGITVVSIIPDFADGKFEVRTAPTYVYEQYIKDNS